MKYLLALSLAANVALAVILLVSRAHTPRGEHESPVDMPTSAERAADDKVEGFPVWFHSKFWHFEQYKHTGSIDYVLADDIIFQPPDPHRLAPKLLKAGLLVDHLTMPTQRPDGSYSYELTVEGEGLFRIVITREMMRIEKLPNPAD